MTLPDDLDADGEPPPAWVTPVILLVAISMWVLIFWLVTKL